MIDEGISWEVLIICELRDETNAVEINAIGITAVVALIELVMKILPYDVDNDDKFADTPKFIDDSP